jgi:hypothetical protein
VLERFINECGWAFRHLPFAENGLRPTDLIPAILAAALRKKGQRFLREASIALTPKFYAVSLTPKQRCQMVVKRMSRMNRNEAD